MLKSTLLIVQRVSQRLLQMPDLVRAFQRKSPTAVSDLLRWIDDTEAALSGHGMVAAAELAGFKARILTPAFEDQHRGSRRRRQFVAALALLHDLQRATQDALQPMAHKVDQARDLVRHLLQIVAQSGAVQHDPAQNPSVLLEQIWSLATTHEQLRPIVAQMRSLLPADDIRMLLAEEFDPLDFVPAASAA